MADAQASGACGRKIVWVQVPSPALFFSLPGMMGRFLGGAFFTLPEECKNFLAEYFYIPAPGGRSMRVENESRRVSAREKLSRIISIIPIFHKIKKIKIFSKKVLTFL